MTRIPTKVKFPFGYEVKVRLVKPSELGPDNAGEWSKKNRTIYIDRTQPFREKVDLLAHELGHAFIDWWRWANQEIGTRH